MDIKWKFNSSFLDSGEHQGQVTYNITFIEEVCTLPVHCNNLIGNSETTFGNANMQV